MKSPAPQWSDIKPDTRIHVRAKGSTTPGFICYVNRISIEEGTFETATNRLLRIANLELLAIYD